MCLPPCPGCSLPRRNLPSKKNAALLEPDADAALGASAESIMKRPAGAGIDAGAGSMKKWPATGAAMKRPSGGDCTAIVPVDDPDPLTKDRNKWGFFFIEE